MDSALTALASIFLDGIVSSLIITAITSPYIPYNQPETRPDPRRRTTA
jgi:hypothetical protein